jgi:hypothetical protein
MERTFFYTLSEAEFVAWNHADPENAQCARDEIVERVGKQAAAEGYEVFLVNDLGGCELGFGTTNPLRFLPNPMHVMLMEGLVHFGDARKTWQWPEGNPDYVEKLGLREEHIPALISAALQWTEADAQPEGDAVYAPIHAWRALAQLGTVEAVEPLLGMLNTLSEQIDDWYLQEFPTVFALIGREAIPMLAAYLADAGNSESPRIAAADGLKETALRHPATRDEVVAHLTRQLEAYEDNRHDLNAFLVSYLLDLKAAESAEVIERAYAARRVDEWVAGHWGVVRRDLGVPGMGLAPDGPPDPGPTLSVSNQRLGVSRWPSAKTSKRSKKSKRKSQKQARKKSRNKG